MKIAIGADHAGYLVKEKIKNFLNSKDIEFTDYGTFKEESVDYPEFAFKVANAVANDDTVMGILICGTGIGMSITANKVKGIRAAVVNSIETAELSRLHNNANVLCLGARTIEPERIIEIVVTWMNTSYEGGRHEKRVNLISKLTGL
ncbi:MAG: ribose 5-phosphate isomerase B [Calditrichae bacterium]|nr:ribose 5-phosphate isomerase B [Calditrichota bacterium]MCB9057677.1 ribose 5-phosphate isomerase B [Calditrichia bacterium]